MRKFAWHHIFPAGTHARGGLIEENGNVGAEVCREFVQRRARCLRGKNLIEREERGSRIAAPAAKPRAVRDVLRQRDPHIRLDPLPRAE